MGTLRAAGLALLAAAVVGRAADPVAEPASAVSWRNLFHASEITVYSENYRTKEFYGQLQRDVFGSISISFFL